MCDYSIMKNPLETTTKTPTGWLMIDKIEPHKDWGDPVVRYVEKCENEYERLQEILHTDNKLRTYMIKNSRKSIENYRNEQDKVDINAWFNENWEVVNIMDIYGYFFGKNLPDDKILCRIYEEMISNDDINIDAIISGGLTLYNMKRKAKKKHKVVCPHCGKLQSRVNIARHKRQNCKVLKEQSS